MTLSVGLIIWGVSIDKAYHWMVGQVAFFLFAAGIQMGNTVITSYIVDSYPLQSMSVITFYSVFLNLSAFINPVSPCFYLLTLMNFYALHILLGNVDMLMILVLHRALGDRLRIHLDLCCSRHNYIFRLSSCLRCTA